MHVFQLLLLLAWCAFAAGCGSEDSVPRSPPQAAGDDSGIDEPSEKEQGEKGAKPPVKDSDAPANTSESDTTDAEVRPDKIDDGRESDEHPYEQASYACDAPDELGEHEHTNRAPVAETITVHTKQNTPVEITLAAVDPDGDALAYEISLYPSHGGLIRLGGPDITSTYRYVPTSEAIGTDVFEYSVTDGEFHVIGTVQVVIGDCEELLEPRAWDNQPPIAALYTVHTREGEPVEVTLVGTDPDGDELTFQFRAPPPQFGDTEFVEMTPQGSVYLYTPHPGYVGTDEFRYLITDGQFPVPGTVTIVVEPLSDSM